MRCMTRAFHSEALKVLNLEPVPDSVAFEALRARERQLGIRLPASFVEWYGMQNGIELLRGHSNRDEPIPIEKLGERVYVMRARDALREEGVLPFMIENQSVCVWGLRLDGTDDPAVVVAVDPKYAWCTHSDHFSTFIATQIWDYHEVLGGSGNILVQAQDKVRPDDLEFLRRRFRERVTTHGWPGDHQYRFEGERVRIVIWDSERETDWWIAADDEDSLVEVLKELSNCGGLRKALWSNDDLGERVLSRLNSEG